MNCLVEQNNVAVVEKWLFCRILWRSGRCTEVAVSGGSTVLRNFKLIS